MREVVVDGPNAGETIRVWEDGGWWVQRTLPRMGRMQKMRTDVPWQFAYSLEAARQILACVLEVEAGDVDG